MHYRFNGADNVFEHRGPWTMDGHPKDAAFAILSDQAWRACTHLAQAVPYSRFAQMHAPCEQAECGSACKRNPVSGVIGVQKGTTIPMV